MPSAEFPITPVAASLVPHGEPFPFNAQFWVMLVDEELVTGGSPCAALRAFRGPTTPLSPGNIQLAPPQGPDGAGVVVTGGGIEELPPGVLDPEAELEPLDELPADGFDVVDDVARVVLVEDVELFVVEVCPEVEALALFWVEDLAPPELEKRAKAATIITTSTAKETGI